jgi:hypothetical protein|tara:strand:- start:28 stop:267 length:240 start_codon:yes stop_codon:yes gene_type:complete
MLQFLRPTGTNCVLEAYTERPAELDGVMLPEFKVNFNTAALPRYAILARNDDNTYSNLSGYDTLKECEVHITELVESRS